MKMLVDTYIEGKVFKKAQKIGTENGDITILRSIFK